MIQLPITTETGEPRTGYVLDIFNPRAILCGDLPARVALLKAIFGIDEHGQLTKPIPPQSFFQDLFTYIMCGKVWQRTRKPPTRQFRMNGFQSISVQRGGAAALGSGPVIAASAVLPPKIISWH